MRKVFLSAALALAVAGSWAFYPKAATDSAYMVLSVRVPASGRPSLVSIAPNGTETPETLNFKRPAHSIRSQAVVKLNELRSQGWSVVQMTSAEDYVQELNNPSLSPSQTLTETYLLERK
jgi:hypothetical protein